MKYIYGLDKKRTPLLGGILSLCGRTLFYNYLFFNDLLVVPQ